MYLNLNINVVQLNIKLKLFAPARTLFHYLFKKKQVTLRVQGHSYNRHLQSNSKLTCVLDLSNITDSITYKIHLVFCFVCFFFRKYFLTSLKSLVIRTEWNGHLIVLIHLTYTVVISCDYNWFDFQHSPFDTKGV